LSRQSKQLSPQTVQTLSAKYSPRLVHARIVVAQDLSVAMKVNPVIHASSLHSPAVVQVVQLVAQAEQAPLTIRYPEAQVVQAVAEHTSQLAPQATQLPESLANIASHVVQVSAAEQVAQLDPHAEQASSAITCLAAQTVQTSAAVHVVQLALHDSQDEEELTKKVESHESAEQAVAEEHVAQSDGQASQAPLLRTCLAAQVVQVSAAEHTVQLLGQASQVKAVIM